MGIELALQFCCAEARKNVSEWSTEYCHEKLLEYGIDISQITIKHGIEITEKILRLCTEQLFDKLEEINDAIDASLESDEYKSMLDGNQEKVV
jgi:hypothetical protein